MSHPDKSFEERIARIQARRPARAPFSIRGAARRLLIVAVIAGVGLTAAATGLFRSDLVRERLRELGTWSVGLVEEMRLSREADRQTGSTGLFPRTS